MIAIAAVDANWAIGYENRLLARIPEDQKFFRETTSGGVVVMGRKTLESFPGAKPLPKRINIVLSGNADYRAEGAVIVHDEKELAEELKKYSGQKIFLIGGAYVYRTFLDHCETALITKIDHSYTADAYFPNLDEDPAWELVEEGEPKEHEGLRYRFCRYERRRLTWEKVKEKHIIQNEWIDFRETAYRLPDGTVFEPFYSFSRRDYVVIVATDEDGKFLCVRQFRQGIERVTVEFPAGGIERKDGKEYRGSDSEEKPGDHEDSLAAAKRELLEETGYESDEWTHLLTIPSNATISDNFAYVYAAGNCRRVSKQSLDETEFLHVELHSEEEIREAVRNGEFAQAVHVMAWLLWKEAR